MFPFMASHLLFFSSFLLLLILEREKYMIQEKIKKKNAQKNVIIFSSNLNRIFGWEDIEILFSLFLEKLYRIEFSLKKHQSRIN